MLRTLPFALIVLAIALCGGAGSVWLALHGNYGVGAVEIDGWTAFPEVGTPGADTYSKARFAREGGLSLGQSEGVVFVAANDSMGRPLQRACEYAVEGQMPAARFWTLHAADQQRAVLAPLARRAPALHSLGMMRDGNGAVRIGIARHPLPGNWLAVSGSGPMLLVLALYDAPTANASRVSDIDLPPVVRGNCDG